MSEKVRTIMSALRAGMPVRFFGRESGFALAIRPGLTIGTVATTGLELVVGAGPDKLVLTGAVALGLLIWTLKEVRSGNMGTRPPKDQLDS